MSANIHAATLNTNNPGYNAEDRRAFAVGIALELISAKLSAGASTDLEGELSRLSGYADEIQEALKVK
ncbi:hypothetical protein [Pseudomonas sp. MWU13-2517]|uniref:hypothetical protein n=1 Tax=Pseudomonas sp. MWU13-2517 TaxID=2929055 RepID=UPI00200DB3E5|nr:hypothetical protein [Pseudomonas sp. MWU13-2517]